MGYRQSSSGGRNFWYFVNLRTSCENCGDRRGYCTGNQSDFIQNTEEYQQCIERTPPVLLEDIRKEGILLIGGAARLKGIEKLISRLIGVEAQTADKASYVNAVGAGAALEYIDSFRDSLQDLH